MGLAELLSSGKTGSFYLLAPAKHILADRKFLDDAQGKFVTDEGVEVGVRKPRSFTTATEGGGSSCRAMIDQYSA